MTDAQEYIEGIVVKALATRLNALYCPPDVMKHDEHRPYGYQFSGASLADGAISKASLQFHKDAGRCPQKFLDIGCGLGLVNLIALRHVCGTSVGIDASEILIDVARVLRQCLPDEGTQRLLFERAWAEDFDGYGEFDILYHFNISAKGDTLRRLVAEQMHSDAILIDVHGRTYELLTRDQILKEAEA